MAENDRSTGISCGFFNAQQSGGTYDRTYNANDMNMFLALLTSDGVLAVDSNNFRVSIHGTGSSFEIDVNIGTNGKAIAVVDSHWMVLTAKKTFQLSRPSTRNRIDTVILKCDSTSSERECWIEVVEGTPSTNPQPYVLQNEPGSVVEYRLADINVNAGSSTLTATNIVDARGTSDCPWITALVNSPDTTNLFNAYQEAFENAIGGTIAGQLQTRVSALENKVSYTVYSGTGDPSSSMGQNGDLYFKYES